MPIDLKTQRALNPTEAARSCPSFKSGKPCHPSKIVRLITKGSRLPDGTILRLDALRLGNQWVTSLEAIEEYGRRLAAARIGRDSQPVPRPSAARRKELERVARELDSAGLGSREGHSAGRGVAPGGPGDCTPIEGVRSPRKPAGSSHDMTPRG